MSSFYLDHPASLRLRSDVALMRYYNGIYGTDLTLMDYGLSKPKVTGEYTRSVSITPKLPDTPHPPVDTISYVVQDLTLLMGVIKEPIPINLPSDTIALADYIYKVYNIRITKDDISTYYLYDGMRFAHLKAKSTSYRWKGEAIIPILPVPYTPPRELANKAADAYIDLGDLVRHKGSLTIPSDANTVHDVIERLTNLLGLEINRHHLRNDLIDRDSDTLTLTAKGCSTKFKGSGVLNIIRERSDDRTPLKDKWTQTHFTEFPLVSGDDYSLGGLATCLRLFNSRNGTRLTSDDVTLSPPKASMDEDYNTTLVVHTTPECSYRGEVKLHYNRITLGSILKDLYLPETDDLYEWLSNMTGHLITPMDVTFKTRDGDLYITTRTTSYIYLPLRTYRVTAK